MTELDKHLGEHVGNYIGERVIECPVCFDSNLCFEDMHDNMSTFFCLRCGYTSNSLYVKDSDTHKAHIASTAKLVHDLEVFDEDRQIFWYPSVLNMGKLGIIYPEGTIHNWHWKYAKVNPVPEKDKEKYPVKGKPGEFHNSFLDLETATEYEAYDFLQALRDMGLAKDIGK
jgi:hypothetical protein